MNNSNIKNFVVKSLKVYIDDRIDCLKIKNISNINELCKLITKHNNCNELIRFIIEHEDNDLLRLAKSRITQYIIFKLFGKDIWDSIAYDIEFVSLQKWNGPIKEILKNGVDVLILRLDNILKRANIIKSLYKIKNEVFELCNQSQALNDVLKFIFGYGFEYKAAHSLEELFDYNEYLDAVLKSIKAINDVENEFPF